MTTVRELLRDADPLRREPDRLEGQRDRLRQAVVAAARDRGVGASGQFRRPAMLAVVAMIAFGIIALVSQTWSRGGGTLQAQIRFEVRLAEDRPAAGLREVRVAATDRVVYLHPDIVITNGDIERSTVVQGDGPSRFHISVAFNAAGTRKMRQATAQHIGSPLAILIDGEVVMAPTLRSPISSAAVITGDYTRAEAERIVNGIGLR